MFYYISFLRPPPTQAAPYAVSPFNVKLQISNDLRTESYTGIQEIYYSWISLSPSRLPNAPPALSKPKKLTTWHGPASAYKDIPVPVPQGVRDGQYFRLILTGSPQAHGNANPECIDLSSPSLGTAESGDNVFPVISMPVHFLGKGHKNALKQEEIEREYLVLVQHHESGSENEEKMKQARLRFVEKTSFDLDKKIWDSGIGLSSWLVELKHNAKLREQNNGLYEALLSRSDKPRRIIELGAGIGIVSVALGVLQPPRRMLPGEEERRGCILSTDVPSAMPLLSHNISLNESYFSSPSSTPKSLVLDWDNENLPDEVKELGGVDVIVMADVTYNTSSFPSLCRTVSRIIRLSAPFHPPLILLGYKQRDEAERSFWGMMKDEAGVVFEKIGERVGYVAEYEEGTPVEIWCGSVTAKQVD